MANSISLKYKPTDYLSGSQVLGKKYKAWDTYGQGTPDLGKGAGPGMPYHVVSKTVKKPKPVPKKPTPWQQKTQETFPGSNSSSAHARMDALKRRLGWA